MNRPLKKNAIDLKSALVEAALAIHTLVDCHFNIYRYGSVGRTTVTGHITLTFGVTKMRSPMFKIVYGPSSKCSTQISSPDPSSEVDMKYP